MHFSNMADVSSIDSELRIEIQYPVMLNRVNFVGRALSVISTQETLLIIIAARFLYLRIALPVQCCH